MNSKPDDNRPSNQLSEETSPYLLQHSTNPVNWYPWGETAIALARQQDKPILLSIGYSACHWCHVMMHESFCDPEVAATMNRLFINIKVDKEERPDLDKIYQTAYQLLLGHPGGWPLTLFLSPHTLIPYYGGTYFPKNTQPDLPGFQTLLHRLNEVYYHEKEKIQLQELHTGAILQVIAQSQPAGELPSTEKLFHQADIALQKEFDPLHGGFGTDAKFPNCPSLEFLLSSQDVLTRQIAFTTMNNMALGGIYDQLAGGFFRYTVDEKWHIPHFEKMLYDNAQLLGIYAQGYKLTQNTLYKRVVMETADWLTNVMLDRNNGGFYTALDADSDGQEGAYYLWEAQEIKDILTTTEYSSIHKYYQLDHKSNFDDKWHLLINHDAKHTDEEMLKAIKRKLLQHRVKRIPPALDNKILTAWNGLAIKGFSIAGQVLNDQHYLDVANNVIKFIIKRLFIQQQLYASWQNNLAKIPAFLDDYAFLLDGILTYMNGNIDHEYIGFCKILADSIINNFYDMEYGGFFFSSHNAQKLFYRPKTFTDEAIPSGNGITCLSLLKLGKMLNNEHYLEVAKRSINSAQTYINEAPEIHLNMLAAYGLLHGTGSG